MANRIYPDDFSKMTPVSEEELRAEIKAKGPIKIKDVRLSFPHVTIEFPKGEMHAGRVDEDVFTTETSWESTSQQGRDFDDAMRAYRQSYERYMDEAILGQYAYRRKKAAPAVEVLPKGTGAGGTAKAVNPEPEPDEQGRDALWVWHAPQNDSWHVGYRVGGTMRDEHGRPDEVKDIIDRVLRDRRYQGQTQDAAVLAEFGRIKDNFGRMFG